MGWFPPKTAHDPLPNDIPPAQKGLLSTSIARTSLVIVSYDTAQAGWVRPESEVTVRGLFSVLSMM